MLDAVKLKPFFKSNAASTVVEFLGVQRSIALSRVAENTIVLSNCPPPIEQQEVVVAEVPWGPDGCLRRYLFSCPYCARRVANLYVPWSGSGFACRRCHGITYRPRQDHLDVLLARYSDLGRRLGQLVKLRATSKEHVVPPVTADQIDEHVRSLLRHADSLRRKVEMHGGHVGA